MGGWGWGAAGKGQSTPPLHRLSTLLYYSPLLYCREVSVTLTSREEDSLFFTASVVELTSGVARILVAEQQLSLANDTAASPYDLGPFHIRTFCSK